MGPITIVLSSDSRRHRMLLRVRDGEEEIEIGCGLTAMEALTQAVGWLEALADELQRPGDFPRVVPPPTP